MLTLLLPLAVFLLATGAILGGYSALTHMPGMLAARRLDRRLRDVSFDTPDADPKAADDTVVKLAVEGPLPGVDRLLSRSGIGFRLAQLIAQSGMRTSPSAVLMISVVAAIAVGLPLLLLVSRPYAAMIGAAFAGFAPFGWLMHSRSRRLKRFEEQFPEALDLLSRAIRAGHSFQTALGMVADELKDPVGPEFKKTFEQQNFGLPLRDALNEMAARIAILDVRFFVTAVLIQRDTGGNLSEILDNLAHVVRERFKIRRQIRVHTAHGRFTGYVLLALPAALAIALSVINPEHMQTMFHERMGQTMLMGAIVMQTIGFLWIRQVIKIEV
jgi:tight adherence protein B